MFQNTPPPPLNNNVYKYISSYKYRCWVSNCHLIFTNLAIFKSAWIHIIFNELFPYEPIFWQLFGPNIQPRHCVVAHTEGIVTVTPTSPDAEIYVEERRVHETTMLRHGVLVRFGKIHVFQFCDPNVDEVQTWLMFRDHSQLYLTDLPSLLSWDLKKIKSFALRVRWCMWKVREGFHGQVRPKTLKWVAVYSSVTFHINR